MHLCLEATPAAYKNGNPTTDAEFPFVQDASLNPLGQTFRHAAETRRDIVAVDVNIEHMHAAT